MATLDKKRSQSWIGKIPVGLRWLLMILAGIAVAVVVIKYTSGSGSDATAQPPAAAPPAAAPAAQAVPPPAQQAQTIQLTPVQQQTLYRQLADAALTDSLLASVGISRATKQAAEQLSRLNDELRLKALTGEIQAAPFGPITQEANGTASVNVRVKALDHVYGKNGEAIWTTVAQKDITLYFTLDAKKELKEVTGMRRLN